MTRSREPIAGWRGPNHRQSAGGARGRTDPSGRRPDPPARRPARGHRPAPFAGPRPGGSRPAPRKITRRRRRTAPSWPEATAGSHGLTDKTKADALEGLSLDDLLAQYIAGEESGTILIEKRCSHGIQDEKITSGEYPPHKILLLAR